MNQSLLQQYINNPDRHDNTPDCIVFGEEVIEAETEYSYPFAYIQEPATNQFRLVFGKVGKCHCDIYENIANFYKRKANNDFQLLDEVFDGYIQKEYDSDSEKNVEHAITDGIIAWFYEHYQMDGRYFLFSVDDEGVYFFSETDTNVCVFSFWCGDEDSAKISKIIKMIMVRDRRISQCDLILIANNEEPYYVYKEEAPEGSFKVGDNSAQLAIHLANQQQKRDFFADFRATRDKKIGQKLTMSNGKEMPLAQYNALRYVDESKNGPKRIFITEAQLNEYLHERKKKQYSWKDKLELVRDKNIVDGGNFPIKRNGKQYWISRSMTVGVYVYCKDENGIVYTIASKRGPHVHTQQNLWNAPCGYLEYGDSIKETAVKECWEETGVKIPMEKLVYLGENSEYSRNSDVKHTFYCVLDGVISNYPPSMANCEPGEVTDVRWIPLEELNKYHFVGRQAEHLYNVGTRLFEREGIYKTNEDYAAIMQSLQNMLSKGIIDDRQVARIKDVLNI